MVLQIDIGPDAPELHDTLTTRVFNVGHFQVPFRCDRCFVGSSHPRTGPRAGIGGDCQQFAVIREWAEASDAFRVFLVGEFPRVVFVELHVVRVVGREPDAVEILGIR